MGFASEVSMKTVDKDLYLLSQILVEVNRDQDCLWFECVGYNPKFLDFGLEYF